jgi:predicted ATPase
MAEYSDGTLIVLALVAALVLDAPLSRLTCIEELENCLHPAAQERLLRFLVDNSQHWQLLITTHSPYLVNGVAPEDVVVAVVDDEGRSHFERTANIKKINDLLKAGMLSFGDLMATNFQQALGK